MSYGTQTESEYFRIDGSSILTAFSEDLCFGYAQKGDHGANKDGGHCDNDKGGYDDGVNPQIDPIAGVLDWETSLDYLLANEAGCDKSDCVTATSLNTTMSIEIALYGLTRSDAETARDGITALRLHMSDEARGLPPVDIPPIPVPAAFWLFGTALIGFIGISRRTNLS